MRRSAASAALVAAAALAATGCGNSGKPQLTVSAAASLTKALTTYAHTITTSTVRLSFGGSDLLAAQIRQGVRPDVFVSANTVLPQGLYTSGLVERPVPVATNTLVVAVPRSSRRVTKFSDLTRAGVKIAVGSATVPVGAYTRVVLDRLPRPQARSIARNIRSSEPDVTGVVGKLTQGAADAGFLYMTDVRATHGALRTIPIPAGSAPPVVYAAAVVKGSSHETHARAFITGLLNGAGAQALGAAGFGPAPAGG